MTRAPRHMAAVLAAARERSVLAGTAGQRAQASLAALTVAVLTGAGVLIFGPGGGPDRLLPPPVAAPQMVSYDRLWRSDIAELTGPGEPPVSATAVLPSPAGTDSRVDLTGVPGRVLEAYRAAADRLAGEQPGCDLRWPLLAAIGQVESGHGTFGGAVVATDGRIVPEIIGVRLDGAGPVA
ncbi:MAG: hypothetical protein M3486_01750, partial [Actinomycetota bacterium]|nr:hypothetical protein [Actinomycetota bacterium]